MDAEGGEQIELMLRFYAVLLDDASSRGLLRDEYYFLSDQLLNAFKRFQSIPVEEPYSGYRLEQAVSIWDQTPRALIKALMDSMFRPSDNQD